MPLQLKNPKGGFPPGGFPFQDKRTGKKFDGMSADLKLQAMNVIQHRRGNMRLYPATEGMAFNSDAVQQEILEQVCANHRGICVEQVKSLPMSRNFAVVKSNKSCPKCGNTDLTPKYCKTCSGSKIRGWTCDKCGTEVGK